ncbi:MAG: hypothetical protein IT364_24520 [Candidatus Hydrogenedentes bacterium]|nr:hypothetical protein [Candidatus Hydrogenedentota bacterium]
MRRIVGTVLSSLGHLQEVSSEPDHADPSNVRAGVVYDYGNLVGILPVGGGAVAGDVIDTFQVMYEYLSESGSDLYDLVGARIWGPKAPKQGWTNDAAAIVFHINERTHPNGDGIECQMVTKCYGGTALHKDARAVYRALEQKMRACRGAEMYSGRINVAELISAVQDTEEPDTGYPLSIATHRVVIGGNGT